MVQLIPNLDPWRLLPPLLACLPTSFVSARPPPALLPLLSPILRQRVQILSDNLSRGDSWLGLLCWDDDQARRLPEIVESNQAEFEPHPVSGEVEIKDAQPTTYQRLDEESLQAKSVLTNFGLEIWYLWCRDDDLADNGSGWKVAGVGVAGNASASDGKWHTSITEAEEAYASSTEAQALRAADVSHTNQNGYLSATPAARAGDVDNDDDDDDYWQQYDRTPGNRESPDPTASGRRASATDEEHYSRYADVQPAMDNDEPETNPHKLGSDDQDQDQHQKSLLERIARDPLLAAASQVPDQDQTTTTDDSTDNPPHQQQEPPPSNHVAHLEEFAASRNVAEVGIKQHISTSLKSLYRLSQAAGIDREEFERLVQTELEVLSLMETA